MLVLIVKHYDGLSAPGRSIAPRTHTLGRIESSIGRASHNDVILPSRSVSRRHARISQEGLLEDLGSTNGTFVNGRRASGQILLRDGDEIRIGEVILQLRVDPALPAKPSDKDDESDDGWDEDTSELAPGSRQPPNHALDVFPHDVTLDLSIEDTERALLAAIGHDPDDDAQRQVYADWLLEREDRRGELIALQCAYRDPQSGDTEAQRARLAQLLERHGEAWLRPALPHPGLRFVIEPDKVDVLLPDMSDSRLRMSIARGFFCHPFCVAAEQESREALFRLMPAVYQVWREVAKGTDTIIHEAVLHTPDGQTAIAALKRPRWARLHLGDHSPWDNLRHRHEARAQLERELAVGCLLDHPNVTRYLGLSYWGQSGDVALASELAPGWSLGEIIEMAARQHPVPLPVAVYIALELSRALAHVHTACDPAGQPADIVHCALRPNHVMVDSDLTVTLLDFSEAKATVLPRSEPQARQRNARARLRRARMREREGEAPRNPWHMSYKSPEQAGHGAPTPRSDIYSLAVLLYEMVCCQHPYHDQRRGLAQVRRAIRSGEFPAPSRRAPMPDALDRLICRAMATEPDGRHGSAGELAAELEELIANQDWPPAHEVARTYFNGLDGMWDDLT